MMLKFKKIMAVSVLSLAAAMPAQAATANFVLDSFTDYNISSTTYQNFGGSLFPILDNEITVNETSTMAQFGPATGITGVTPNITDNHDVFYTLDYTGIPGVETNSEASVSNSSQNAFNDPLINAGLLDYSSGGITPSVLTISYTGIGTDSGAFGSTTGSAATGYDINGLYDGLLLNLLTVDQTFNLALTISYIDVALGELTESVSFLIDPTFAGISTTLSFANFTQVDFSRVSAITSVFSGDTASDFQLTGVILGTSISGGPVAEVVTVVSAPTSLALLGLGLIGLGLRRRKLL